MQYPYVLLPLPYAYDALVPEISDRTLHFHHDKHVQAYVDNLNKALSDHPKLQQYTLDGLLMCLNSIPEPTRTAVRNNGGGVYNHYLYFDGMLRGGSNPHGPLLTALEKGSCSVAQWKQRLKEAAMSQFGSGYGWLVTDRCGAVSVVRTPNQVCPLTDGLFPLLCVDVWEHAYYLDYQNRRGDYVDAWLTLINWEYVSDRYNAYLNP